MHFEKHISIDQNVRFGKPCIRNTRIAVEDVMNWISSGKNVDEILYDFPELTKGDIEYCIAYSKY